MNVGEEPLRSDARPSGIRRGVLDRLGVSASERTFALLAVNARRTIERSGGGSRGDISIGAMRTAREMEKG